MSKLDTKQKQYQESCAITNNLTVYLRSPYSILGGSRTLQHHKKIVSLLSIEVHQPSQHCVWNFSNNENAKLTNSWSNLSSKLKGTFQTTNYSLITPKIYKSHLIAPNFKNKFTLSLHKKHALITPLTSSRLQILKENLS